MYLIFDTETTGLPKDYNAPITNLDNWPRMVQLAWQLHDESGELIEAKSFIVYPDGFDIPFNASKIHGITTQKAKDQGIALESVLEEFQVALKKSKILIGHNLEFDVNIVGAELLRIAKDPETLKKTIIDTKDISVDFCALPGGIGGKFKWPTLMELHQKLFGEDFSAAHNASADVEATARSFFELFRLGLIKVENYGIELKTLKDFQKNHPEKIKPIGLHIKASEQPKEDSYRLQEKQEAKVVELANLASKFSHIHNHTSFSVLSSTIEVNELIQKALDEKMPAVGITDYGNMMGAFLFSKKIESINQKIRQENEKKKQENLNFIPRNPLKGVIGCEFFISENYTQKKFTKDKPDRRHKQVLLAKNKQGYLNLSRLSSEGYIEGYYAGFPRISKELIEKYKGHLIALSGDLGSEIPYNILNYGEQKAESIFCYWHELFGEDFYVELLDHGLEEEKHVNELLLKFARKYKVKYIVQNNNFYLEKKESIAHDILLCVKDGEKRSTPIGRGRGYRFGFSNEEFYFKSGNEMAKLFSYLPEAFDSLSELISKIEPYGLAQKVSLPKFEIPLEFKSSLDSNEKTSLENQYLRFLAYEGAARRYGKASSEIQSKLDFELNVIEKTGYPGYFLIVQDFIKEAKKMDVWVGPGRGSVAGSLVAYCIGITEVDPLKYDLLFERFLNPDRISLPDIDIDFDDRGRDKVIAWVVNKYGQNQVAQIITYGKMAAKMAIRDVGRVLELPLLQTDRLAKLVPTNLSLKKLFSTELSALKEEFGSDEIIQIETLKSIEKENSLEARVLKQALILEGSLRNTGVHACGVIITPFDTRDFIPMALSKDSDLLLTQFDNSVVEEAGLLKMDFLGLRTLTIMKDALVLIKKNHNVEIDLSKISLEDKKTYEVFQKGQTIGVFQYESLGMQKHLKDLKPDRFEDLIAMNALYRPGPLQYIPNFIARKHGREPISYDFPKMEEYLRSTYGITVYQEQVMLLAQEIAGFSKGEADILRKAMGKKQKHVLDKMKDRFIKGAIEKGYEKEKLNKTWQDWEFFASYAFNKSHSTCYAYIAFQSAYLKAHYKAEYLAAVLSNHMKNIKDVSFFMEECKNIGVKVLGPDVNESELNFTVNTRGDIRFGMGAIKGVGEIAVESIIGERENGRYTSIYDLVKRVDLRIVNKKTLESLALAGAFDEFSSFHRAQYFYQENGSNSIEKIIRFASKYQESKKYVQNSLFGDSIEVDILEPDLPHCEPWNSLEKLSKEKEVVGIYISSHPLDEYKLEINYFTNLSLDELNKNPESLLGKEFFVCGIVSVFQERTAMKSAKKYGTFTLEDYSGNKEFRIFGEEYLKYKHLLCENTFLHLKIRLGKWQGGDLRIEILQMGLLEEIIEKLSKELTIKVDIETLTSELVDGLNELIDKYKGDKKLNFLVFDTFSKTQLRFISKKKSVKINKALLEELSLISELSFVLN